MGRSTCFREAMRRLRSLSRIGYMSTDSTAGDEQPEMQGVAGATDDGRVYVVTPQGMAVEARREQAATDEEPKSVTDMVEEPAR